MRRTIPSCSRSVHALRSCYYRTMQAFVVPTLLAFAAFTGAYHWGGVSALYLVALLAVLETTLSFDNAVVNAKVLARMQPIWQERFLTWGIPLAVFGTRLVLPILIVSAAALLSPIEVARLAFFDTMTYANHLAEAHAAIASFGGAFLLMVSFNYFFDERKTVHWMPVVEWRLAKWGGVAAIEMVLTLGVLLLCALLAQHEALSILVAGIFGVLLFLAMQLLTHSFEMEVDVTAVQAGVALFAYLNVLDAAFSLDGVVGAFAISDQLPAIVAGLGIGALFVRSFTVLLVRARALSALVYLEHGAHWAIFGLALSMLASLFVHVPETVTGLIGFLFVGLAYLSSRKAIR